MATKLYVGGLSYDTTNDSLEEGFKAFGNVVSAAVVMDKFSGKSRGFGFVEMETEDEAKAAIEGQDGKELDGRKVTVNMAREKSEGERRGGGGGYGGGRNNGGGNSFRFR